MLSSLYRAAADGDTDQADAVHARLMEFVERIERFPVPAGIKRAVELRGQKSGGPSVPLGPETALAMEEFAAWFRDWIRR